MKGTRGCDDGSGRNSNRVSSALPMPQRSLSRRLRELSITPKHIVLAVVVIAVFLLLVTMLGQANTPG
jgi:hypothetical protein